MEQIFKKKVLYVFCFESYSGAEIVMERLITHNLNNVEPVVLCPDGDYARLLASKGIKVIIENALQPLNWNINKAKKTLVLIKLFYNFFIINLKILYLIIFRKNRIVHSNNLYASFYSIPSILFCKLFLLKRTFIWSNHDLVYYSGNTGKKAANLCHKFYDKTIAVSNAVKNNYPLYKSKITVLYNGLDTTVYKFDSEKRKLFRAGYNLADDQIVIGIIGAVVEHKGHLMLLRAIQELTEYTRNFKLFIVGRIVSDNSEFIQQFNEIVSKNSEYIHIISHTKNIADIYCGIDILVNATLPFIGEPLGTTVYEGMAFGRVVLGSDTGGTKEIIDDGVNGFLFKAGEENIDGLKEKLIYSINNYHHLDEVKANAVKTAQAKFNIDKMVADYNDIINS
jgi:glycosyltransferase involved in cell wall biosynthesis